MIELQNDGWILRNKIIWHKPNHMPSSVKDRLANTWEYIFHFVKSRRYYYDLDSIREPHKTGTPRADRDLERMRRGRAEFSGKRSGSGYQNSFVAGHPSGRNPGDVIEEPDGRGKLGSHRRIMRDCGYVNQHSGYMLAGLKLKSRQGVDIRNPKGKNPSDVIHGRPVRPPHHPYRGDGWEESALERGVVGNHPFGKNPGDVVQTKWSGIEGRWSGGFGSGGERSHWRDPAHYHSMGKNPGDIVQGESYRRKTAGLGKMLSMRNAPEPGEPHAYHGRGKNPGDVVCAFRRKEPPVPK